MDYVAVSSLLRPADEVAATPLSTAERASLTRCRTTRRHRELSVSRRLMRYGLVKHLELPVDALTWPPNGPCYDDPHRDVGLSVAHSGHHAVVAMSPTGRIGVDIEDLAQRARWRRIVGTMFCEQDADWVIRTAACDEVEQLTRFYAVWTAREAYAKYTGTSVFDQLSKPLLSEAFPDRTEYVEEHACIEVKMATEWVMAVCRPLRVRMPACRFSGADALSETAPYRANIMFLAGAPHQVRDSH